MKRTLCLLSALVAFGCFACGDKQAQNTNKPSQNEKPNNNTDHSTDAVTDQINDGNSESGNDSTSDNDGNTEVEHPVDNIVCEGPDKYLELPFIGKIKTGFPCNLDVDCESGICDRDSYHCANTDGDFDDEQDIKNLPEFYPCFDDEQCASGICQNYEEDLSICAKACKEGDKGNGNFSCQQMTNTTTEQWSCQLIAKSSPATECANSFYDCGDGYYCIESSCVIYDD